MTNPNKRVALKYATFAAIFGLMCLFMDMMEETEEQTTYSTTLENLIHAQSETNGEAGGAGTDGENDTGGGGTTTGGSNCDPSCTLWTRNDQDCIHKITGEANAEIKFLGITIKLNANGEGQYVYGSGKTHCIAGGNEQCTARYCPPPSPGM